MRKNSLPSPDARGKEASIARYRECHHDPRNFWKGSRCLERSSSCSRGGPVMDEARVFSYAETGQRRSLRRPKH